MQFLGRVGRDCEDDDAMLGRLRSVLGVAFLAGCTWCSFVVPLGDKTFVEHLDAIGDTPEAEALRTGANQALVPTLEELQYRVLGEYVEAPTASDVTLASGTPTPGKTGTGTTGTGKSGRGKTGTPPRGPRVKAKARDEGGSKATGTVNRGDSGKTSPVPGRTSRASGIPRAE